MKKLLVDSRLPAVLRAVFAELGYEAVGLPQFTALAPPVASHPDMLVYSLPGALLVHADYYAANETLFADLGKIQTTAEEIAVAYPADILLNALNLGGVVYGRLDRVSGYIKSAAAETVDVRQGYARCSVCAVTPQAIITADPSIAAAAESRGVDVLAVSPGGVALDGYLHGFIGGASCLLDIPSEVLENGTPEMQSKSILTPRFRRTLCFFGAVESHPDCAAIKRFAEKHGAAVLSLSNEPLYDYGGAVEV